MLVLSRESDLNTCTESFITRYDPKHKVRSVSIARATVQVVLRLLLNLLKCEFLFDLEMIS